MGGVDILGSKDETETSYLKDDLEVFFLGYPDIFGPNLKKFSENIVSQEKRIMITNYFQEKLQHHLKLLLVFCKSIVICMFF